MLAERSLALIANDLPAYAGVFASMLAAAMASSLATSRRDRAPWRFFAWAAFLLALGDLLWHVAKTTPCVWALQFLSGLSVLCALALMVEFGRRDLNRDSSLFNPALYIPVLGLSLVGMALELSALMPMLLFAWGLPAFLCAFRLFRQGWLSASRSSEVWTWKALAAADLAGGLCFCLAVFRWIVDWPSGELVSFISDWAVFCVWPLLFLPPLVALTVLTLKDVSRVCSISVAKPLFACFCAFVLSAVFCGAIFFGAAKLLDDELDVYRREKLSVIKLVDEAMNGSAALASSVSELLASTPGVPAAVSKLSASGPEPSWLDSLLDRQVETLPFLSICFVLDKNGLCLASSSKAGGKSLVGRNFSFRAYFKNTLQTGSGFAVAVGSATLETGVFSSRAIRSESGATVGVAVVKTGLRRCVELAGNDIAMIFDADGKSLISNNMAFEQTEMDAVREILAMRSRSSNEPVFESLALSRKPGRGADAPILIVERSKHLPALKIGLISKPDSALQSYRIVAMSLAFISSLCFAVLLALRCADFWGAVAMKRSLSWRKAVLDSQSSGVAIFDASFEFLEVNKVFSAMFGVPAGEEAKGAKLGALFKSFIEYERFVADAREALLSRGSFQGAFEFQGGKEGETLWCELSGRLLEELSGASASVWTFSDRTEAKLQSDLLKESEARYKAIFDNSPAGITIYDGSGQCVMANPAYSLVSGGSLESVLKQNFRRLKSWRASGLFDLAEASLSDGRTREMKFSGVTSFGKNVVARCVLSSMPFGKDRLLALMVEDQTARDLAEERQKTLLAKYEQLFKLMPAAAFTVDRAGRITSFNSRAESITGYSASELIGRSCRVFTGAPCTERCGLFAEDVKKPVFGRECVVNAKDGRVLWIVKNADLLRDASGNIEGGIEAFYDITPMKESEEKLKAACKAAEDAAFAKSEFLSNMSHEIRGPMNEVVGLALLLLQSSLDKAQSENASGILRSSERLLSMVNDILDIARIEAGKFALSPVNANLKALVSDAAKLLSPKASARRIEISCALSPSAPEWVSVDLLRLRQVVFNLISNAIDFTSKGRVEVRLSPLKTDFPDPDSVAFRVEVFAPGPGIAPEVKEKLFEKFAQADLKLARFYGETGLSLAVCKQLITLMNGAIGVESEPNEGVLFHFELSLPKVEPSAEDKMALERALNPNARFDARALVVEDNLVNRMVVSGYLKRLGCRVDEAFSGEMAVGMFRASNYDIVMMDIILEGGMDGFEAAALMRKGASAAKGSVPIVALTGSKEGDEVRRCLQAGMDGFLSKPISFDVLVKELSRWLRPAPGFASSSQVSATPQPRLKASFAEEPSSRSASPSTSEVPKTPPVVDEKQIGSVCAGDPEILESVLEVSPGEFAGLLVKLEDAVAKGDMAGAGIAAHSLKGASSNIGGAKMASICLVAEKSAKAGKLEEPAKTLAAIRAASDELFAALRELLARMKGAS